MLQAANPEKRMEFYLPADTTQRHTAVIVCPGGSCSWLGMEGEGPAVAHKRSRRALLGEYGKWSRRMRDSLSIELHLPDDMPPVFLATCDDDPVINPRNSYLLDSVLTARHLPHTFQHYQRGGHGFGVDSLKAGPEAIGWKAAFLRWLDNPTCN